MTFPTGKALMTWRGLLFALLPVAALAQPKPLDPAFDRALSQAYLYNPQLLTERARLRETDEGVPRALSGWRPNVQLRGSAGASAVFDSIDTAHQPERRTPQDADLALTQPLYTGGRVGAQVAQAEALVVAERAALQASEAAVLLAAATAYLDVARDERIVQLNRNQTAVLERTLRATEQELAAGAVTETDVAQARARLADQRANQAQTEGQLAASRASFQQEVGDLPGSLALPKLALPLPADRRAALALVPGSNFDIQQARSALEASRQGIDIARAGLLPKVSLELRGSRVKETDVQLQHQRDNVAEGTLQLSVPLYQGGGPAAETRQAKEAESRSLLQIDVVLRQAQRQAQTAWDMLEAGRTRMTQAQISIDANTVATRGVARQQSVGARTLLDVLNAQQELLNAEVNLARATRDEEVAELQLLAVTGRLTAQQIGLHVPVYDPVRHYDATRDRWGGLTPAP